MKVSLLISFVVFAFGSVSLAKTDAPASKKEVYQLFEDGGEHPSEECSIYAKKLPKLKQVKKFSSAKSYLGSNQVEFAEKNEAGIDAFEHYYSAKADCEKMRAQLTKESEQ